MASRPPQFVLLLHELETKLLESAEKLDRGEGINGEAVFVRLRQRRKARHHLWLAISDGGIRIWW